MFSAHLVILGIVVIVASSVPRARRVLLACAAIPAADTVLPYRFAGLLVGAFALAAAAILLVVGGSVQTSPGGTGGDTSQRLQADAAVDATDLTGVRGAQSSHAEAVPPRGYAAQAGRWVRREPGQVN
ncbi:MAG: hypothetical protein LAO05_15775 [Acidobacteriia bacterium]|nr:hypothetical protein [Terriglobia bacterium]